MRESPTRRTVLQSVTAGSAVAIAGCLSASGSENTSSPTATETHDGTAEPTESDGSESTDLGEWLLASNVVEGPADHYLDDRVRVHVGTSHVPYAFMSADVRVTAGTTVEWYWSPFGGENNVVAVDGRFRSGDPIDDRGETYEYTFDEPGVYRYVSEPHAECGMRGVVRVESVPESGYPEVDRWLADVDNYEGTVPDRTAAERVSVSTGAPGNGGHFAFDPPALAVSPGTTVEWEWTGEGGAHDVHFVEADLANSELQPEAGATFTHTFEEPGVYRYTCRPHRGIGQKGAVVVE